jgi:hypothetical protein
MRTFNPSASHPERAAQAWQILVGMAMNRQTITYGGLAKLMYRREAPGVLASILGHIAYYCDENGLPQLNALVVGGKRGAPGHDIPLSSTAIDATREKVYKRDWYNVCPPSLDDLAAAWDARQ